MVNNDDPREHILTHYFLSRQDAFAQWNTETGQWQCVKRDVPNYLIKSHLTGKITVATYPVNKLGNTPHVCFDLDQKTPEAEGVLGWLKQWFDSRGIVFVVEDTGGRGLHGWALFLCFVPASKAIALANLALDNYEKEVGALPCPVEIFPKQAKPKDVGNPIRLPWGKHKTGNFSHFLPDDETPIKAIQQGKRTTEFDLDKIVPEEAVKKVKAKKGQLVTPDERWGEVIPEGKRHTILLSLAGELRGRKLSPDKLLTELQMHNQQRCQPPLDEKEVEQIVKGVTEASVTEKEVESYATSIVASLKDTYLFHDTLGDAYIRFNHNQHLETWPLDSRTFQQYASFLFYKEKGRVPSSNAITDAIGTLKGKAKFDGAMHELNLRVAWYDNGLWYDLSNEKWQAVRIDQDGWQVVDDCPLIFQRYPHMLPQAIPTRGGNVEQVLEFLNLAKESDKILLLVWLITDFIPGFPHPGLLPYGSYGSGKTLLSRLLKSLIDPSAIETLAFSTNIVEFVQQLSHHWVCFYDNIHTVPSWVNDILCRAITGEGFSKRRLWTDSEDVAFKFRRIVGVNGLELVAKLPDLLDRSILLELEPISDERRTTEEAIWSRFNAAKPEILGAIFDILSLTLGILPKLSFDRLPRMADWCRYGQAVAECLPFGRLRFLQCYNDAIKHQALEALKANLLGETLLSFMAYKEEYCDTISELLNQLSQQAFDLRIDTKARGWPKQPNQLSKTLKAMKPNLEKEGILVTFEGHTKHGNKVRIKNIMTNLPSPPSPQLQIDLADKLAEGEDKENAPSSPPSPSSLPQAAGADDGEGGDDKGEKVSSPLAQIQGEDGEDKTLLFNDGSKLLELGTKLNFLKLKITPEVAIDEGERQWREFARRESAENIKKALVAAQAEFDIRRLWG